MKYNTISSGNVAGDRKKAAELARVNKMTTGDQIHSQPELELVRKALKLQSRRCRQLVEEYTKRLQLKEQQYQAEKRLRDDQLAKVLRTLLVFEARLRQEQKYISHQLKENVYTINKQRNDIRKFLEGHYCKNCGHTCVPDVIDSFDSSSEYYQDYKSSNFDSLDSNSELYASVSEKNYSVSDTDTEGLKGKFVKKAAPGRKLKKVNSRRNSGNYLEVLKMRGSESRSSNDDYEDVEILLEDVERKESKITESIPVFEGGETNDNWYASASDQEDEEQRDVYRNNPVLECMNQILLHNMNDPLNSPPKTPNLEKKLKKVKFSDEEDCKSQDNNDYYETPIQKTQNFYETPQSIYSNDYEQILSQCSQQEQNSCSDKNSYCYVDMDTKSETAALENELTIVRKSKILRSPPALPPKPPNLLSKFKINNLSCTKDKMSEKSLDSEPDYCSISEINLPTADQNLTFTKISVVAEINTPPAEAEKVEPKVAAREENSKPEVSTLVTKAVVEKNNIEVAKQVLIKLETSPKKLPQPEIPKLPQVTEIIIPDSESESKSETEHISHDNYIKNNTQILKKNKTRPIQMGSTVSSLIASFNSKQLLSEMNLKPQRRKAHSKRRFSSVENLEKAVDTSFDLSQNFEEFKLDDCELEDYNTFSEEPVKTSSKLMEFNFSTTRVKKVEPRLHEPTYEYFLECTGLSNKSILTPSRKEMRSKIKSVYDHRTNTIKYTTAEPYL